MSNSVSQRECDKRHFALRDTVHKIDQSLNGTFGIVTVLKEIKQNMTQVKTDIQIVKKNGHMSGRDRAILYGTVIASACSLIGVIVTVT